MQALLVESVEPSAFMWLTASFKQETMRTMDLTFCSSLIFAVQRDLINRAALLHTVYNVPGNIISCLSLFEHQEETMKVSDIMGLNLQISALMQIAGQNLQFKQI